MLRRSFVTTITVAPFTILKGFCYGTKEVSKPPVPHVDYFRADFLWLREKVNAAELINLTDSVCAENETLRVHHIFLKSWDPYYWWSRIIFARRSDSWQKVWTSSETLGKPETRVYRPVRWDLYRSMEYRPLFCRCDFSMDWTPCDATGKEI